MKICYKDSNGFILAAGEYPSLSPGAGESVVDYTGSTPNLRTEKVDTAALPTVALIAKTAGETATWDKDNTKASGTVWTTVYDSKSTDADRLTCIRGMLELICNGTDTETNVEAL